MNTERGERVPLRDRMWVKLAVFCLAVLGAGWGLRACGWDWRHVTPERVRGLVLSFGAWAPIVYLAVYGQPFIPFPSSVLTMAGGLVFGVAWGLAAALLGASFRASTQFVVARWLGRDAVAKMLKGAAASLDQKIGEHGFQAVLFIRLIPNFPFDVQNYGLGFSKVRFWPYLMATVLGIVPATIAYTYLGYSLTDPTKSWKLFVGVLVVSILLVAQRSWTRRPRTPGI